MKLIFVLSVAFCLSGCTVSVNFYLLNQTDEVVKIKAHLKNEKLKTYNLFYDNELKKLKYNLYKSLPSELSPASKEGRYLIFDLPPKSTTFVGNGPNFLNFTFDEIVIRPSAEAPIILNWDSQDLLNTGTSFLNKHYAWYSIDKSGG